MRWFRRSLDDFGPFDWSEDLQPLFPTSPPEPWRDFHEQVYLLPLELVDTFIDRRQLETVKRVDHPHVASLASQIEAEGLFVPPEVVYDATGKVRYHDGYHRYAAIESLGYFHSIPVRLRESPAVRGYGRQFTDHGFTVLKLFAVNADSHTRSSGRIDLTPRRKS